MARPITALRQAPTAYGPYGSATRSASYNFYTGTSTRTASTSTAYGKQSVGEAYNPWIEPDRAVEAILRFTGYRSATAQHYSTSQGTVAEPTLRKRQSQLRRIWRRKPQLGWRSRQAEATVGAAAALVAFVGNAVSRSLVCYSSSALTNATSLPSGESEGCPQFTPSQLLISIGALLPFFRKTSVQERVPAIPDLVCWLM